jgi:hypothetical protein
MRERDEFDTLHWLIVIGAIAAVVAGLIEFNARRQAKASVQAWEQALTITPEQQAKIDADMAAMEAQARAQLWRASPPRTAKTTRQATYDQRPMAPDERCLQHQRFRHTGSTWTQIGTCQ